METKILEFLKYKKCVYLDTIRKNCIEEKDGEFDFIINKLREKGRIPQQNSIYLLDFWFKMDELKELQPAIWNENIPEKTEYRDKILELLDIKEIEDKNYRIRHERKFQIPTNKRQGVGQWKNPDFAILISVEYLNGLFPKEVFAYTFEVKKNIYDGITGVYEAASHRAATNYAYLIIYIEKEIDNAEKSHFSRIKEDCSRLGVGLLTIIRNKDGKGDIILEVNADYHDADKRKVCKFVNECL